MNFRRSFGTVKRSHHGDVEMFGTTRRKLIAALLLTPLMAGAALA